MSHDPLSARDRIMLARTFLFVPGDRPTRFDKAAASGTDIVILDLEDAVAPANKPSARTQIEDWLGSGHHALVRINPSGTDEFEQDLGLASLPGLLGFMLPKACGGEDLGRTASLAPTVALIESAAGLLDAQRVACTTGVVRLAFGTIDLALDLDLGDDTLLAGLGTQLVLASRAHGLAAPIDGVTLTLNEPGAVEGAMRTARARGFGAKLCVHPSQIAEVRRAFVVGPEEVIQAERIVAADRAAKGAAVALDGRMVDRPVVARAYRTLEHARTDRTDDRDSDAGAGYRGGHDDHGA